jgi:esterase/lipase
MASKFFPMLGETGEFNYERHLSEAKACVICFHGYRGSPWETKPVAEY